MKTEADARDAIVNLAGDISGVLDGGRVAHVRYTPGNGTAYEMLLAPAAVVEPMEEGGASERPMFRAEDRTVYVTMLTVGSRSYPMYLGRHDPPMPSYVSDKLGLRDPDGAAVWLLLSAICESPEAITATTLHEAGIHVS